MSLEKFKVVTLGDHDFRIGRLTPAAGSFILGQIMAANLKRMKDMTRTIEAPANALVEQKADPEQLIRAAAMGAMLGGLDLPTHTQIQQLCLSVVSLMPQNGNAAGPLPISTADGTVLAQIADDLTLVMRLETEVLVFNLSDFFAQGGLNSLSPS